MGKKLINSDAKDEEECVKNDSMEGGKHLKITMVPEGDQFWLFAQSKLTKKVWNFHQDFKLWETACIRLSNRLDSWMSEMFSFRFEALKIASNILVKKSISWKCLGWI